MFVECVRKLVLALVVVCLLNVSVVAQDPETGSNTEPADPPGFWDRESLTGNFFGLGSRAEANGVFVSLAATNVYQYNLHDGIRAGDGDYSGSYDLEIEADLEHLLKIPGATIFSLTEGSWQSGEGFDSRAVGSLFGVNDDHGGERSGDVTELWYQQNLLDDTLRIRLGKIDLTAGFEYRGFPAAFDGNLFANDETSQFLNGSLANNPAIPFPDNGLGAMLFWSPSDGWYTALGVSDAEGDARTTGFSTTFDGNSHLFYVGETGLIASVTGQKGELPGSYRAGVWNARIPREHLDGSRTKRDDVGVYFSADQQLWRENEDDMQGFSMFTRLGWADDAVNEIKFFGSVGGQYKGIVPGRDEDVLGCAFAHGALSDEGGFSSSFEQVAEMYYNSEITPWFHLSPSVQWVKYPGGQHSGDDAVILGLRAQVNF